MESEPVKARVTQLLGRTGSRGGITQVKVILITGKPTNVTSSETSKDPLEWETCSNSWRARDKPADLDDLSNC